MVLKLDEVNPAGRITQINTMGITFNQEMRLNFKRLPGYIANKYLYIPILFRIIFQEYESLLLGGEGIKSISST